MSIFIMTGKLPRDAELKTFGDKQALKWSLPDDRGWGEKKTTEWINCTMWGDRAVKLAPFLLKGRMIEVHGEISGRAYEKDGEQKVSLDLNVREVRLHGGIKNDDAAAPAKKAAPQDKRSVPDDEIPF